MSDWGASWSCKEIACFFKSLGLTLVFGANRPPGIAWTVDASMPLSLALTPFVPGIATQLLARKEAESLKGTVAEPMRERKGIWARVRIIAPICKLEPSQMTHRESLDCTAVDTLHREADRICQRQGHLSKIAHDIVPAGIDAIVA